jgi:hypothetical protein
MSWVSDSKILFAPETVSGIHVLDAGSTPSAWIQPSADDGERSLRWPSILPSGAHALFTRMTEEGFDVEIAPLETGTRKRLVENASSARYVPTKHLVFVRDDALLAAPFDLDDLALTGEPVPVVERVHRDPHTGAAFYDFSDEGTLVYVPAVDSSANEVVGRLVRVSRQGKVETLPCGARAYQVPRLSRLGREVLVTISAEATDVWVCELERGSLSRVTFEGNNGAALWTHAGSQITFSSDRDGSWNLYSSATDSSAPARRLFAAENAHFATSWSPESGELLFTEIQGENHDVWVYSTSTGRAKPFLETEFNLETAAVFSPDGRLVAYVSNETGEDEVYVRSYPEGTNKVPISIGGGREPVWNPDGSEIFYRGPLGMMAVPIATTPALRPGKPEFLFEDSFDRAGVLYASYDVTSDGEAFIMVKSDDELSSARIRVVVNWFEELESRVPVER